MVELRDQIGVTSVIVTHDIDTIKHITERVFILDNGHIVWQGTNEQFKTEKSAYPCSFRERKTLEACRKQYGEEEDQ